MLTCKIITSTCKIIKLSMQLYHDYVTCWHKKVAGFNIIMLHGKLTYIARRGEECHHMIARAWLREFCRFSVFDRNSLSTWCIWRFSALKGLFLKKENSTVFHVNSHQCSTVKCYNTYNNFSKVQNLWHSNLEDIDIYTNLFIFIIWIWMIWID